MLTLAIRRAEKAWRMEQQDEWILWDKNVLLWGEHAIEPTLKILTPLIQKHAHDAELRQLYASLLIRKGNTLRDDVSRAVE